MRNGISNIVLSLILALSFFLVCDGKGSSVLAQQNGAANQSNEGPGVPVSLDDRFYFEDPTDKFKPDDTWILSTPEELYNFYIEMYGLHGMERAKRVAQSVDFEKMVAVVVVSLLDTCKFRATITKLERIHEDTIRVTIKTELRDPCQPSPIKIPHQTMGVPIERPVKKVEIVDITTTRKSPLFQIK